MVRVKVPATTANLGSGFDVVGMALELFNEVFVEVARHPAVEVTGEGEEDIPRDDQNLVYRAVAKLFEYVGERAPALKIRLVNRIPVERGLGSSAAAVMAGLLAGNELLGGPLGERSLLDLACEIEGHSDNVAAAFFGGVVVSVRTGSSLGWRRFDPPPGLAAVVAVPGIKVATCHARAVLPSAFGREDVVFNLGRVSLLVAGLVTGDRELIGLGMEDRLHQPYRAELVPGLDKVLAAAKRAGAVGAALSGAGPSVIALADGGSHAVQKVGEAMRSVWAEEGIESRILVLKPASRGAEVL